MSCSTPVCVCFAQHGPIAPDAHVNASSPALAALRAPVGGGWRMWASNRATVLGRHSRPARSAPTKLGSRMNTRPKVVGGSEWTSQYRSICLRRSCIIMRAFCRVNPTGAIGYNLFLEGGKL